MASKYLRTLSAAVLAATIVSSPLAAATTSQKAGAGSGKCGRASWYALTSKTASGERMNASLMTAAHRSLPFGTKVQVTNKTNGKTVVVRINDRGPFIRGRVLDVSRAAAKNIDMINAGHASICYRIVS